MNLQPLVDRFHWLLRIGHTAATVLLASGRAALIGAPVAPTLTASTTTRRFL